MSQIICGIDPGLNGAFSFLNVSDRTIYVIDMPTIQGQNGKRYVDPVQVGTLLRDNMCTYAILEQVHSSPQMGVTSSFSFGRSSGIILGALGALNIKVESPLPSVWKKAMACTADKKQTAARASLLMPKCASLWKLSKNVDRAEASLLALYGTVKLGHNISELTLKE